MRISARSHVPKRLLPCLSAGWIGVAFLGAALTGLVSCGQKPTSHSGAPSSPSESSTNASATSDRAVPPQFAKLSGKWVRPDGGYVLEIKTIDAGGKIEAAYFNPSPIQVAQARALRDGESVKLFVELRDVNYPGCTYSLSYDAEHDQLFGTYFQAAMNQTFDVAFARTPP